MVGRGRARLCRSVARRWVARRPRSLPVVPAAACVALLLAGCVVLLLAGCVGRPDGSPRPDGSASPVPSATREAVLQAPWYRTDLPVVGRIVSGDGVTRGSVRITRTDTHGGILVELRGFRSMPGADLRLHLEPGDVATAADGAVSIVPDDTSVEIAVLTDAAEQRISFAAAQSLPTTIHSLSIVDYTTATVLGAAELIPAG